MYIVLQLFDFLLNDRIVRIVPLQSQQGAIIFGSTDYNCVGELLVSIVFHFITSSIFYYTVGVFKKRSFNGNIDAQLRSYGWEADTSNLRYSKGTRPQKGKNLAIAEWPTDSTIGTKGAADYALFVGTKLVAVVEAKRAMTDIPSVINNQCKDYARTIKAAHNEYVIDDWNRYKVPFVFATNGRKYLKQIDIKSGIWFLDLRQPFNAPKALQGWISPQGIMENLEKDIVAANAKLCNTPYDLLRDPDGLNLRKYQIRAIEAAEKAVIDGKQAVLLSMATGTGKTRTILGMIYRFIKTDRFKRILFLVDRTALGEQSENRRRTYSRKSALRTL